VKKPVSRFAFQNANLQRYVAASPLPSPSTEQVDIVDPSDDPLEADDVLWYAGNASSIAMIRKVPGLAPYSSDQVDKLDVNS
jgi:hypothetical protein